MSRQWVRFQGSSQRWYAAFFILGGSILLFLCVTMIAQGYLGRLVPWVSGLLLIESILDVAWLISSIIWWIKKDKRKSELPLRLAAAAIVVHAVRVAVYVLGRLGPWIDFDFKPLLRGSEVTAWNLGWLYFAAFMATLGVIGVVVVWSYRRRCKRKLDPVD